MGLLTESPITSLYPHDAVQRLAVSRFTLHASRLTLHAKSLFTTHYQAAIRKSSRRSEDDRDTGSIQALQAKEDSKLENKPGSKPGIKPVQCN